MPTGDAVHHHHTYLKDGILYIELTGSLKSSEMVTLADQALQIKTNEEAVPPRIVDLSRLNEINLKFAHVEQFATERASIPLPSATKCALVAPSDLQFGCARMYQALNRNPKLIVEVFRDMSAAVTWIRAAP